MNLKNINNKKKIFNATGIILFILIFIVLVNLELRVLFPGKYFETVTKYSKEYNIDPYLVLAVIKCESNFNINALSQKDAKGLMQIIDSTAAEANKNHTNQDIDLYDIDTNIRLGCKYLSTLISKYNGNYYLAICAYNAGIGNVGKWLKDGTIDYNLNDEAENNIPFDETKKYLRKVINTYRIYKFLYK